MARASVSVIIPRLLRNKRPRKINSDLDKGRPAKRLRPNPDNPPKRLLGNPKSEEPPAKRLQPNKDKSPKIGEQPLKEKTKTTLSIRAAKRKAKKEKKRGK